MERGDAPWRKEDRCEARYGAQGVEKHRRWQTKWYPGTIISVSDDACDVKYDDGDVEMSVPLMFIRAAKSPSAPAAAASAGAPSKSTDATTPPPVPDLFEYVCPHCERSFPSKRGMLIHASRCKSKAARREPPRRETVVVALDDSDDDEDDSSRPGGGGAEKQERSTSAEAEGEEESEESAADSDDDYAGGAAAAARPAGRGRAKPKAPPRKRRKDDDDDDDDEEEEGPPRRSASAAVAAGRAKRKARPTSAMMKEGEGSEEDEDQEEIAKVVAESDENYSGDSAEDSEEEEDGEGDDDDDDDDDDSERAASRGPSGHGPSSSVGKRKVRSTTVMIDGHAVKRSNMYDINEGESSVWDRELGAQAAFKVRERRREDRSAPKKAKKKPKPTERKLSDEQRDRASRNGELKEAREEAKQKRAAFLQPYASVLAKFGARLPKSPGGGSGFFEDETIGQPAEVSGVEMKDYQLVGLRWLAAMHECGVNAILADEMGLGKTLQTIAFLAHLKFARGIGGPHLIICPLSVLSAWMSEIRRFCPSMRALKLHSSDQEERKRLMTSLASAGSDVDCVVTTYEMAKSPETARCLSMTWWRYLVIDEGHVIKNDASLISQSVRKVHFAHALLLTGTPLQNNLHELWALLNFLYPEVFPNSDAFDDAFELSKNQVDNAQLVAASSLLQPFMLRRTKTEVEKGLPPKLETTISCPLSEMQLFWYKRLLLRDSSLLKQLEADNAEQSAAGGTDWKKLSSLLMQLRKCCNHPFLFPGVGASSDESYPEELIEGSGKFQLLDRLLAKLHAGGHRVVLFSQFTSTLDLLGDLLTTRGYKFCRLDGQTNRVQRQVDINAFNMVGSTRFCFLMSTRAGGLGINCQTADTCILFDSDWNPQVDLQAMARVHRIGQKKTVHLYRLVSRGTVEERIVQRAEKKLYLDKVVNRGGASASADNNTDAEELSVNETISMLKFGAACCFDGGEGRPPTDEEIDSIIDRTRTDSDSLGSLTGGRQHTAADFDAAAPSVDLRQLQGATYGDEAGGAKPKGENRDLKHLGAMFGGGTIADIGEAWETLSKSKRSHKSRMSTVKVAGVGDVQVLRENDYEMGGEMPNARNRAGSSAADQPTGRQIAGRDFAHEDRCLVCWDYAKGGKATCGPERGGHSGVGGTLRGCDFCPASYHLDCIGIKEEDAKSWSGWSCPHHTCDVCKRKANHVGGLLFRCSVCPKAYCEDHLPPDALIMGENPRFLALGQRHPKQACYLLHSQACVQLANKLGFDCGEASASAAAILGSTGVDTTVSPASKAKAVPKSKPADTRTELQKLETACPGVAKALLKLLTKPPAKLCDTSPGWMGRALDKRVTSPSVLDHLHDLLYETDLWSQQDEGSEHCREVATKIGAWGGAAAERAPPSLSKDEHEAAAALFLRLVRLIEGVKTPELDRLVKLLGVRRLISRSSGLMGLSIKVEERSLPRRTAAPLVALFLTVPNELALVIDGRSETGPTAAADKKAREKAGDPGFLVNGAALPRRVVISGGQLKEQKPQPLPQPPYKQPAYAYQPNLNLLRPLVPPPGLNPNLAGASAAARVPIVPPLPCRVTLCNLMSDGGKHLNGRGGTCTKWDDSKPEQRTRYCVEIDGIGLKSLALKNLHFAGLPPPAPATAPLPQAAQTPAAAPHPGHPTAPAPGVPANGANGTFTPSGWSAEASAAAARAAAAASASAAAVAAKAAALAKASGWLETASNGQAPASASASAAPAVAPATAPEEMQPSRFQPRRGGILPPEVLAAQEQAKAKGEASDDEAEGAGEEAGSNGSASGSDSEYEEEEDDSEEDEEDEDWSRGTAEPWTNKKNAKKKPTSKGKAAAPPPQPPAPATSSGPPNGAAPPYQPYQQPIMGQLPPLSSAFPSSLPSLLPSLSAARPSMPNLIPMLGQNLGGPWLARQGQLNDALLAQAALQQYQNRINAAAAAAGMQQRWTLPPAPVVPVAPVAPVAPAPPAGVAPPANVGGAGGASGMGGAGGAAPAGS